LQKVGDELAADSGHRGLISAHGFSIPEISLTENESFSLDDLLMLESFDKGTNRWLSAKK